MKVIFNFVIDMIPYMLISIPIFLLVRFIIYKKTNKLNLKREILLLVFYLFLVGLFSQTIIPKYDSNNNLVISKVRLNLIPFKIIYDSIIELKKGNIYYLIISLIGNILMFIIVIGFLISLFIELTQIFTGRETDIDDLILNTLGVVIGIKIYKILKNNLK